MTVSTADPATLVGLLLADAEARPVLPRLVLPHAALSASAVVGPEDASQSGHLLDRAGPPGDLRRQRWGVVVPAGPRGDALAAAISPLIEHRRSQQGAPPHVLRFGAADQPAVWLKDVYAAIAAADRPRYVLIVGDLSEVGIELQRALSVVAFVGRVAFRCDRHYGDYAAKVIAAEAASRSRIQMKFFSAADGSAATQIGDAELTRPCHQQAEDAHRNALLDIEPPQLVPSGGAAFRAACRSPRTLLFTMSHGVGQAGWDDRTRRELQGSLVLERGDLLSATELAAGPFLPGGIWVAFACFGAGTPSTSSYRHWIEQLVDPSERAAIAERTLGAIPADQIGFVAAPAAAALANKDGPLAIVGHVDLAWAASFHDGVKPRTGHISEALQLIAGGTRVGIASDVIFEAARQAANAITDAENASEAARRADKPDPTDRRRLLMDWMIYQDLRNFILLGDPAVTL